MSVTLDLSTLKTLRGKLEELEQTKVRVGLFAETAGRSGVEKGRIDDNPSLGFVHEFGNAKKKIPERSFIRMPLMLHLAPLLEGKDWITSLMKRGVKRTLGFLGVLGEDCIQEAFATGGYGNWPALAPRTIARKKSSRILIESAQLRKAVASKVV